MGTQAAHSRQGMGRDGVRVGGEAGVSAALEGAIPFSQAKLEAKLGSQS